MKIHEEINDKYRKRLLLISLISNLGLLFVFKYFNFFIDSFIEIGTAIGLSPAIETLNIILPVGISFYTFQTLSYTIDIYKGKLKPETDFMTFASYVSFFPQLVAGPIVRAIDLLPQFKINHKISSTQVWQGLSLITLGYFKKLVIADSVAPLVDNVFANPSNYSSLNVAIVVVIYAFQIYCDFSGYSDIAIGLGKMLGFEFPKNFNIPYLSKNFSEFWQRWHISLSSWLRDYLYIPLGGNKNGTWFTQRNLMLTMLIGGLWHGANWTFVVWGFLHGMLLIIQRVFEPFSNFVSRNFPKILFSIFSIIVTFVLVNLTWVFFRSQSISEAFEIIQKILSFDDLSFAALKPKFQLFKAGFVILVLFIGEIIYYHYEEKIDDLFNQKTYLKLSLNAFLIWMILLFGTFDNNNFIYFQF